MVELDPCKRRALVSEFQWRLAGESGKGPKGRRDKIERPLTETALAGRTRLA